MKRPPRNVDTQQVRHIEPPTAAGAEIDGRSLREYSLGVISHHHRELFTIRTWQPCDLRSGYGHGGHVVEMLKQSYSVTLIQTRLLEVHHVSNRNFPPPIAGKPVVHNEFRLIATDLDGFSE
ncbi:Uncharacterised protein [Mycobacteroides abscessus subsp. massiliense]|uniref:Uncharacterized protein n=1 Tax=Mycobacteroides abscessus subsp. massiliense TaxID=1962118 RepID=A0A1T8VFR9_9MYCO|nr:Uncharacterised protein [Mycobacteroides abscessus subsp. massiliense]